MKSGIRQAKLPYVIFLMIVIPIILMSHYSYAQDFEFLDRRKKDVVSFKMVKNLIIIPVYMNGKGPYNFILDTGVGPLIISDPTLADSLHLKNLRPIKIAGLGKGDEIEAFVSAEINLKLGNAEITRIPTAILKEDLFLLSNYVGMPIHGLLGYHFFKSFIVEIKYSEKKLTFYLPSYQRKIKGNFVNLELINDKPYATIMIESPQFGRIPAKVLVDNGASHAVSLEILDEKPFQIPKESITANLGMGLGGPISGSIGRITSMELGGFTLKNVLASFPDFNEVAGKIMLKNRNGNLGAEVLSRFNITFDYSIHAMYIRKNNSFKRPFEHDMGGMEIFTDSKKEMRYFIGRIEPDSPAEAAGILQGDEVLYINFAPAANFTLDDITKLLKGSNGKTVILAIGRGGNIQVKLIKLKQRI